MLFWKHKKIFSFSFLVTVEKDVGCWVKVEKDMDSISVAVFSFSVIQDLLAVGGSTPTGG